MIQWHFSELDKNMRFLVKTSKEEYINSAYEKGKLCFNLPKVFNAGANLSEAQKDKHDSFLSLDVQNVYVAPVIAEDDSGITYGDAQLLTPQAKVHYIANSSKRSPLCSFRRVDPSETVHQMGALFFKLGNVVDRIKNELGHDSFMIIYRPGLFFERLRRKTRFFARSVHYGEIDHGFREYLKNAGFEQASMFQKDKSYEWQKEFRIILPPIEEGERQFVEVGPLNDIAIRGEVEQLRRGVTVCGSGAVK